MGRNTKVKKAVRKIAKLAAPALNPPDNKWFDLKPGKLEVPVTFGAGKKYDAGKAPVFRGFIQYFPRAIKSVSMVSAFGAKKYNVAYEEVSYQKVDEGYGRYSDADARHLIEECINPVDADSELEHAQMHAWNAMARLEMLLKGRETSNGKT